MRRWLMLLPLLPAVAFASPGVLLNWSAPAGETFNVYRGGSACGGSFLKIASGLTSATYTDFAVRPGGSYSYTVTAVIPGAPESSPSNCIVQVIPPTTIPPAPAPTSLTGTLISQ